MDSFTLVDFASSFSFDLTQAHAFPTRVHGITGKQIISGVSQGFGFVFSGRLEMQSRNGGASDQFRVQLVAGMHFTFDRDSKLELFGSVLLIETPTLPPMMQFGGPIEKVGRLKYIDGCSDSLLIPPIKKGDPCLNLLVFPPATHQRQHTHPSYRVGVVVSGRGECWTGKDKIPLMPGQSFFIPAHLEHGFTSSGEGLSVIAYHPDSDWGPTDEVHPMINRTVF